MPQPSRIKASLSSSQVKIQLAKLELQIIKDLKNEMKTANQIWTYIPFQGLTLKYPLAPTKTSEEAFVSSKKYDRRNQLSKRVSRIAQNRI